MVSQGILRLETRNGQVEFPVEIADEIVDGAGRSYFVGSLKQAIRKICLDFLNVHRTFDSVEITKIMECTEADTIIEALCICTKQYLKEN